MSKIILVENETKKTIVLKEFGIITTQALQSTFLDLPDTPASYAGQADMTLAVNATEDGLIFVENTGGGLEKVEDDTAPKLGGNFDVSNYKIFSEIGRDLTLDVDGLPGGNGNLVIQGNGIDIVTLSHDVPSSELVLDLGISGIPTRIVGLPTNGNRTPALSEALSYQYLVDNGVLNPMVANLNAARNNVIDTQVMFFGDQASVDGSGLGIQSSESGTLPAMTSSDAIGFTTLPTENTLVLVPEHGQPIMFSADAGNTVTMSIPARAGDVGQILTIGDDGVAAEWSDAPEGGVTSVDGRTGNVVLNDLYSPLVHTHVEADITDLDKYTQSETDALLANKSALVHTHVEADITDLDKYTQSETDALLTGKANAVHTHVKTDITDFSDSDYATAAQGITADSAIQPGDNNSLLVNNSGYITLGDIPANTITSVFSRTGDIVAEDGDYDFNQLGGVELTDLAGGQYLIYNGTAEQWENITVQAPGAPAFGELTDVTLTAPEEGQVPVFRAGIWVNEAQSGSGGGDVVSVDGRTGIVTLDDLYSPIVHTHVKTDITDFSDSDYATATQGITADTAIQPGDNNSLLVNNSGYITLGDIPSAPVSSVDGRTGVVVLSDLYAPVVHTHVEADITDLDKYTQSETDALLANKSALDHTHVEADITDLDKYTQAEVDAKDATLQLNIDSKADTVHTHVKADITDFVETDYATSAQGALADTALQSSDNISELTNDAGFITAGDIPADAVTSVDGRTGVVTLSDLYAPVVHTHVEADITDLDKYTQAEVDSLLAGKADTVHTHVEADITDLDKYTTTEVDSLLAGKADNEDVFSGSYNDLTEVPTEFNPSAHTHIEADITDLDKYTQAEVDQKIVDHTNANDPHPQYLTPEDLPSTVTSWFTNDINPIDVAFLTSVRDRPGLPVTSISGTATTTGTPVVLGQWLRDETFDTSFDYFETQTTYQFDIDCTNTNAEFYVEFYLRRAGGGDELLATSDVIQLSSDRRNYTGSILIPGPISVDAGDSTFTRIWINKNSSGQDPEVTLHMEGNGVTRVTTVLPIPTYPAPHATSHEVGGTDQISHDNIAGANGYDSHATIDSKISNLEDNVFLDGDTIDNGTY